MGTTNSKPYGSTMGDDRPPTRITIVNATFGRPESDAA